MNGFGRILAMCGVTKCCKDIVDSGIVLAKKFDAELYLIHIIHNPFGLEGWNLPMISLEEDYFNLLKESREELDAIVEREQKTGLRIKGLVREGLPIEVILKTVEEEKIDLIIMHSHEESRMERLELRLESFLFGNTKESIIRKMPCSIMLVKQGPDSQCF